MTALAGVAVLVLFAIAMWGDAVESVLATTDRPHRVRRHWSRFALEFSLLAAIVVACVLLGCSTPAAPRAPEPTSSPRVVRVRVSEPCTTLPPPPVPLEEGDADPHDGAQHDRIICGALEPWDCDAIRRAVWAMYGRHAAIYIEEMRRECARAASNED